MESSQPDYVMMGMENVGLMYGNEVILKDATFSVQTGERVGLVGPNGGGKVSIYIHTYCCKVHSYHVSSSLSNIFHTVDSIENTEWRN